MYVLAQRSCIREHVLKSNYIFNITGPLAFIYKMPFKETPIKHEDTQNDENNYKKETRDKKKTTNRQSCNKDTQIDIKMTTK